MGPERWRPAEWELRLLHPSKASGGRLAGGKQARPEQALIYMCAEGDHLIPGSRGPPWEQDGLPRWLGKSEQTVSAGAAGCPCGQAQPGTLFTVFLGAAGPAVLPVSA